MRILIAEDDFTSRVLLQQILKSSGEVHIAVNGKEAVEAVRIALNAGDPYELICLDIMMPEMDGLEALKEIRTLESSRRPVCGSGAKIVMTTALDDVRSVARAFGDLCDGYLVKPIEKAKLLERMREFGLPG